MMTVSELLSAKTVATPSYNTSLTLIEDITKDGVFFFDIDNCLYDVASGISDLMVKRIADYGISVGIPKEKVEEVTLEYYKNYGLAIKGFIKHHDLNVDQSLPLETILKPDLKLRNMLESLKMKRWAFTNANRPHAEKCLRLLGIADLFDGITYCDYSKPNFTSKPDLLSYSRAMAHAQVSRPELCFFVDDSIKNLNAARQLGWNTILVAGSTSKSLDSSDHPTIRTIHDLQQALPSLFQS